MLNILDGIYGKDDDAGKDDHGADSKDYEDDNGNDNDGDDNDNDKDSDKNS